MTEPTLMQLFYASRSLAAPLQVESILTKSRQNNKRDGVTGALLFTGGYFAQVLEGEKADTLATMDRIWSDPRHENVKVLLRREPTHRQFGSWTMALSEVPGADDLVRQLLHAPTIEEKRAERLIDAMFHTAALPEKD
jgi:hypothetical protein